MSSVDDDIIKDDILLEDLIRKQKSIQEEIIQRQLELNIPTQTTEDVDTSETIDIESDIITQIIETSAPTMSPTIATKSTKSAAGS